jgi:cell division protein FtsB
MNRIRRLVLDKNIGRRCYFVSSDEMNIYVKNKQLSQYNANDALTDTVSMQNQEIKNLKTDILTLHARINQLTNTVNKNQETIGKSCFEFAHVVCSRLDQIEKKK